MPIAAAFQRTDQNRSRVPIKRGQTGPTEAPAAESALADNALILADVLARLEAAEAMLADHEARIADLEP